MVKQISVFIENKPGRLYAITNVLAENNINIRALSVADTTDFGIMRLIVDKPDDAKALLRQEGHMVKSAEVIAIEIPDSAGGLAKALKCLKDAEIIVEYMYAFVGTTSKNALVILKTHDIEKTKTVLKDGNISVLSGETVYSL